MSRKRTRRRRKERGRSRRRTEEEDEEEEEGGGGGGRRRKEEQEKEDDDGVVTIEQSHTLPHTRAHTHTPVAPKWRAAIGEKLREAEEDIKLFSHKYRGPSLQIFGSK